jgi:hypothetical protein
MVDHFLPHPFQFIIHLLPLRSTLYSRPSQVSRMWGPVCKKDKQFRFAISFVVTMVRLEGGDRFQNRLSLMGQRKTFGGLQAAPVPYVVQACCIV